MSQIICKYCGTINEYRTEKKGNNLVAFCKHCDRYIKNIPYSKPQFHFGKYKGIYIEQFNTPEMINYLHWVRQSVLWPKLTASLKSAINEQLG